MSEIQFKQDGEIHDTKFEDVPSALLHAGFMANQFGSICRVLLDGKEIALIRPHQSHSGDELYQVIAGQVLDRMTQVMWETRTGGSGDE